MFRSFRGIISFNLSLQSAKLKCFASASPRSINIAVIVDREIKIALVGAGMFGGDVHARAYADLQRSGISAQLGRVGLDHWTRDFAPIKFNLVPIATRTERSARRARHNFKTWTGAAPKSYFGARPWLQILRDFPDLDVMAVPTPHNLPTPVILAGLPARGHLITEKQPCRAIHKARSITGLQRTGNRIAPGGMPQTTHTAP